jgi:hypothetical protein
LALSDKRSPTLIPLATHSGQVVYSPPVDILINGSYYLKQIEMSQSIAPACNPDNRVLIAERSIQTSILNYLVE